MRECVVVSAYQTVEKRKLAVFFDLPGKLNVGVLFVKVIVKTITFLNITNLQYKLFSTTDSGKLAY